MSMNYVSNSSEMLAAQRQNITVLYAENGKVTTDAEAKVFAKEVILDMGDKGKQTQYFVRIYNEVPLDPLGPDARRDIWRRTILKKTRKDTFDAYLQYLQTRNRFYMTKAQRSYING